MKKLKCLIWLLLLVCLAACAKQELPEDYIPKASENPFLAETGYKKPEINLDGVLDDSKWDGLQGFTFGDEISATVKAFYGESGIYVGALVHDSELWAMSGSVYDNSSFEVYLDYSGTGGKSPEAEQIQFFVDINEQSMVRKGSKGLWVDTGLIKNYAVKINGVTEEKQEDNSYCVELFVPYSQIGGEPQVDYCIAFGLVGCREGVREIWRGVPGVNVHSPQTYLTFYRDTGTIETERKVNSSTLNIDGKADDAQWQSAKVYPFGDYGRGSVQTCFDENGVCFFLKMTDDKVSADGTTVFLNDSVEIYLDALSDGGSCPGYDDVQVRVDVLGNIEFLRGQGTAQWYNATHAVFTGSQTLADGYAVEVYIPWVDLGWEKMPDAMKVSFGSVDWDGSVNPEGTREITWSGIGSDPQIPGNYVGLTAQGVQSASGVIIPAEPAPELPTPGPTVAQPEISLDGVLSDSYWNETPSHTYHEDTVKVNWFWTELGCYFGFTVQDGYISTGGSMSFENSSVELYLDYNYSAGEPDSQDRTVLVDAAGNMLARKGENGAYMDFVTGNILTGVNRTDSGYVVELFIPWAEFGGNMPQKMGVAFGQVTLQQGQDGTRWHNDGLCPDPQDPDWYSAFTRERIG